MNIRCDLCGEISEQSRNVEIIFSINLVGAKYKDAPRSKHKDKKPTYQIRDLCNDCVDLIGDAMHGAIIETFDKMLKPNIAEAQL